MGARKRRGFGVGEHDGEMWIVGIQIIAVWVDYTRMEIRIRKGRSQGEQERSAV